MLFHKKPSGVDYLIVGLGNPGKKYERTRHNAGFMAIAALCEQTGIACTKRRFEGLTGNGTVAGQRCALLMPQTFMNLSGQSVGQAMRYYGLSPDRCIILFDDVSLPVGKLRVRRAGSHGGHNGMRNIIDYCGGDGFPRVKIGVGGKPHEEMDLADHVLSRFRSDEWPAIEEAAKCAADAVVVMIKDGADQAMARFN